jgi:hypothetical protein
MMTVFMWPPDDPSSRLEKALVRSAKGADPFTGQILESRARCDTITDVSNSRIVDIATNSATPFLHDEYLLNLKESKASLQRKQRKNKSARRKS